MVNGYNGNNAHYMAEHSRIQYQKTDFKHTMKSLDGG